MPRFGRGGSSASPATRRPRVSRPKNGIVGIRIPASPRGRRASRPRGAPSRSWSRGRLAGAFLLENPNETAAFALVLAGGLGTRMGPLTDDTPKPLIPVAGKPMIEHVLRHLVRGGVRDVTIATNYLADRVEGYVGCGARYGLKINYIREEKRMGTAGALSLLDPIPKDPFFVVNADILTKLDLRAFARHHARSGAAMTLAVARHVLESPFGVVRCDGTRIVGLVEKPVTEQWVNAGLYVVSPSLVSEVPRNSYVDMTTMIGKLIARGGRVEAFAIREYWRDAGTPADLARADLELRGEPAKGEGADPNKRTGSPENPPRHPRVSAGDRGGDGAGRGAARARARAARTPTIGGDGDFRDAAAGRDEPPRPGRDPSLHDPPRRPLLRSLGKTYCPAASEAFARILGSFAPTSSTFTNSSGSRATSSTGRPRRGSPRS